MEFTVGDVVAYFEREYVVKEIYMTDSSGAWCPWIILTNKDAPVGFKSTGFYGTHENLVKANFKIIRQNPRTF